MNDFQSSVIVHDEGFDASRFTDHTSLARAYMDKPDQLIPTIVFMMGQWSNMFPLTHLTLGQNGGAFPGVEVNALEYEFPFIGKKKTTSQIVSHQYSGADQPGKNNSYIYLVLKDSWFRKGQQVRTKNGSYMRVMFEPEPHGVNYRYTFQMYRESDVMSLTEISVGSFLSQVGGIAVTQSRSMGNYGHHQFPGKKRNQISILRQSYRIAGAIASKTVEFRLKNKNGQTTNLFIDWYEFQQMLEWMMAKEEHLWTSQYNRNENGVISMIDPELNQPIPTGAGVIQQIRNEDTYSKLTDKKISTILGDVFRGTTDGTKMDVVLYTHDGGMIEFDEAMKDSNIFRLVAESTGDKFVQSAGGNLILGGYFKSFRHIDGHVVTLKKLPMLSTGGYADNAPKHPSSGLPLTTYEYYFLDQTRYDGIPNIQYIYEKNRMEIRGLEQGMSLIKGQSYRDYQGNGNFLKLATEQDASSIHFLATCGIQMLRDTHSFKLLPSIS